MGVSAPPTGGQESRRRYGRRRTRSTTAALHEPEAGPTGPSHPRRAEVCLSVCTTEPLSPGDDLLVTLRRSAQDIFDRRSIRDVEATLDQLVAAAVAMVPAAVGGGISRADEGTVRTSHATDDLIHHLDDRQSALNQGPCITAAEAPPEDGSVLVVDLAGVDAGRWPGFAPAAVELGFRSMLSTHLGTRAGGPRSALNLYAHEPNAFDAQARVTAGLFAVQVALVLYGADEAQMLERAVDSRDVIGQAKGHTDGALHPQRHRGLRDARVLLAGHQRQVDRRRRVARGRGPGATGGTVPPATRHDRRLMPPPRCPTPSERPRDLHDVLERAARTIAAGTATVEYTEDAALHAPIPHRHETRVELPPETDASLRRSLGPAGDRPQARRST